MITEQQLVSNKNEDYLIFNINNGSIAE